MNPFNLRVYTVVVSIVAVMFSAVVHEVAHGYVAFRLGDPTAKEAGRLTLDPRAHLDPFGSFVLPMIMAWLNGPVFAFAKPVPYNPSRLRNRRRDEVLVALAGPASNIVQAVLGGIVFALLLRLYDGAYGPLFWLLRFVSTYVYVNCVLAFFNLIPLPPLDGSKIVTPLLSGKALERYYQMQRYSMPVLLVLLYALPYLLHFNPLGVYLNVTAGGLADLILGMGA